MLIAFGGRSPKFWPFGTWPLYNRYSKDYKKPQVTYNMLKIYCKDGNQYLLLPGQIDHTRRKRLTGILVERVFTEKDHEPKKLYKQSIITYIEHVLNVNISKIELWKYTWEVRIDKVPPLTRDNPISKELIGKLIL